MNSKILLFSVSAFLSLTTFSTNVDWPNIINNPGFETSDEDNKPASWSIENLSGMKQLLNDKSWASNFNVGNGSFETLDKDGFIEGFTVRKAGGGRYVDFKRMKWTREQANALNKNTPDGFVQISSDGKCANNGKRSLKFEIKNSSKDIDFAEAFLSMDDLKPNSSYRLSFKYKQEGSPDFYLMPYIKIPGKGWRQLTGLSPKNGDAWNPVAWEFRTGKKGGKMELQFRATCKGKGKNGSIWIDDVRMSSRKTPWADDSWSLCDASKTGRHCLKIKNSPGGFAISSSPDLPINSSRRYRLSAWVKGKDLTGENYLQIVWLRKWKENWSPGDISGISNSIPLTGSFDWEKIEITSGSPPDTNRAMIRIVSSKNKGALYVDDLFFDGFGNQDMVLLYSQAGYQTNGYKDVVIQAKDKYNEDGFVFIFPVETGEAALKKKLSYLGKYKFGKHYYGADFSELKKPGGYFIEARFGEYASVRTPSFEISDNRYKELGDFACRWYYFQRCGCNVRGWHPPCHLDDAWISDWKMTKKIKHHDLTGGWHDAGDMNKWTGAQGRTVWELSRYYRETGNRKHDFLKAKLPDLLEECEWGARYLFKAYAGKGKWRTCCKAGGAGLPTAEETDNIPGTNDDRYCNLIDSRPNATLGIAGYAVAIAPFNKRQSSEALKIAEESFDYDMKKYGSGGKYKEYPLELYGQYPVLALTALELYRATQSKRYLEIAGKMVSNIAEMLVKREYLKHWIPNRTGGGVVNEGLCDYALALAEYAGVSPKDRVAQKCLKALSVYADDLLATTQKTPLGIITPFAEKEIIYSPARHLPYILYRTAYLSRIARILNRPELIPVAEKNLQYAWGRNFAAISQMAFVGDKWTDQFTHMNTNPGHSDSMMPGAVNKGHGFRLRDVQFPYANLPMKFPQHLEDGNQEVWLFCQDAFMNACIETSNLLNNKNEKQTK